MAEILAWLPVLWMGRLLALVLLGTALLVALGLALAVAARLLRPSNLQVVVAGNLPTVRGIKGRFSLLGQEFEANAELDNRQGNQLVALQKRIAQLEESSVTQATTLEWLRRLNVHKEQIRDSPRTDTG